MNILSNWLRHYLPALAVSDRQLADDLTLRGIAVEGVHALGPGNGHLFEMDITTNRVDAMNHYGIAREAATIYNLPLAPLDSGLPAATSGAKPFSVAIEAPELCGRFTARVLRNVTIAPSTGRVDVVQVEQSQCAGVLEQHGEGVAALQDLPGVEALVAQAAVLGIDEVELPQRHLAAGDGGAHVAPLHGRE